MQTNEKFGVNSLADSRNRVEALLEQMTLAEKVGQMTQVEKDSITPEQVSEYAIGSILSGGGGNPDPNNAETWAAMVRQYAEAALQSRLGIPIIYGVDAVHGHNNVRGAVIFPHNVGLGASRDADLVERIAYITAKAIAATGIYWDFAPAVSVPQDIRWGRSYEGYSEDTDLVIELSQAYIRGLHKQQDNGKWVLPSVKHFVGDGATSWNSTKPPAWLPGGNWQAATDNWKIDQGDAEIDEATLNDYLRPYKVAVDNGALNIMVSFSSLNGHKMHANKALITDKLKDEWGFQGFVVSDWMAIDQLDVDFYNCVVIAINAGLDMIMVPYDFKRFVGTLTDAVQKGDIPQARIDDAVRRILGVKFALGLFEDSLGNESQLAEIGSEANREVAREAVRKSAVLLKNEGQALPLAKDLDSLIISGAAQDIGAQCGGWSISWQGERGNITEGSTILEGIKAHLTNPDSVIFSEKADFESGSRAAVGVVVLSEDPYAEGQGDQGELYLSETDIALLKKTREHCDTLIAILLSGRPLVITDQLDLMDAFVAAWWPGTEGAALADNLFGTHPFTGKLAYTWYRSMDQLPLGHLKASGEDPLWEFGYGLS